MNSKKNVGRKFLRSFEQSTVGRKSDESVGHGDLVENPCLEVPDEDVWSPQSVELTVVECDVFHLFVVHQPLVSPQLT